MSEPSQSSSAQRLPLSAKMIARRIHLIRNHRVMLDSDLADLYGVSTAALNQQVKRNRSRFPKDFAFRLTPEEFDGLMSQIVISKQGRGGRRKLPWVFSEHGVAMLSSVLRSERAVQVNIAIMRTFVRLREMLSGHKELLIRLDSIERNLTQHDKHFKVVFDAIRKLMEPPSGPLKRRIGFHVEKD